MKRMMSGQERPFGSSRLCSLALFTGRFRARDRSITASASEWTRIHASAKHVDDAVLLTIARIDSVYGWSVRSYSRLAQITIFSCWTLGQIRQPIWYCRLSPIIDLTQMRPRQTGSLGRTIYFGHHHNNRLHSGGAKGERTMSSGWPVDHHHTSWCCCCWDQCCQPIDRPRFGRVRYDFERRNKPVFEMLRGWLL